jgi:hypothetical protein
VTGKSYRAAIQLHGGFEFKGAEMGSSTFSGVGEQRMLACWPLWVLTYVAYGPQGLISEQSYGFMQPKAI